MVEETFFELTFVPEYHANVWKILTWTYINLRLTCLREQVHKLHIMNAKGFFWYLLKFLGLGFLRTIPKFIPRIIWNCTHYLHFLIEFPTNLIQFIYHKIALFFEKGDNSTHRFSEIYTHVVRSVFMKSHQLITQLSSWKNVVNFMKSKEYSWSLCFNDKLLSISLHFSISLNIFIIYSCK